MLVLPTSDIPNQLVQLIDKQEPVVRKMVSGYRNKLTQDLKLVLKSDQNSIGQAYCYKIIDDPTNIQKIKAYKNGEELVENVQNNFVVVANPNLTYYDPKNSKISVEQFQKIIAQLSQKGDQKIAKNILLGIFDSFKQLEASGLLPLLMSAQNKNEPIIQQQPTGKKGNSGDSLFEVPQYNHETGEWGNEKTIKLKLAGKDTQQQKLNQVSNQQK